MKEPKVIIRVEGGVVCSVYANIPALDVVILDYDSDKEFNREEREAQEIVTFIQEQKEKGNTAVDFVEVY